MERFIADLVQDFESGKINRRQFCETVALAATVYAAGEEAANAAPSQGFKMIAVNHISYACPDYRKARVTRACWACKTRKTIKSRGPIWRSAPAVAATIS